MSTDKKHIPDLHNEHQEFMSSIHFYRDDIRALTARLEEVATKNTKTEVTSQIEHFQNQFIRQLEVADELEHEIKLHEKELAKNVSDNPVAYQHRTADDHATLRDDLDSYKKIYTDLRNEFNRFLEEVM